MPVFRFALWIALVTWAASVPLRAQQPPPLSPGDVIRLETAALGRVMGRVQSLTAEELVFRTESRRIPFTVPVTEISILERRRTVTRGRSAWTGAKWGVLVGAIPGAISLAAQHDQVGHSGMSVGGAAALGAISGGLFGGLVGAAIGAGRAGDRWEQIEPSLLVGPAGSARLSLSITF